MWNCTFVLTHLGSFLTLWWGSLSAPSSPAGAVPGLPIQPVLLAASSGRVHQGAHLEQGRCVCPGTAGKPCLLTGSQTPPSSACCSSGMFALSSAPAPGKPCPALPREAGCSRGCWHEEICLLLLLPLRLLGICKHKIASSRTGRRRNVGIREEVVTKRRGLEFSCCQQQLPPFFRAPLSWPGGSGQYLWVKMRDEGGGKTTALLMLFSEHCFAFGKKFFKDQLNTMI